MVLVKGFRIKGPKGEYEIERPLNRPFANISEVYLAYAHSTSEWVAIKMPVFAPDRYLRNVRRVEREIMVLQTVRHHNLVALVDSLHLKEPRNDPCAVEEYVRGGRMLETYRGRPTSVGEAAQIMVPLIDAASALHRSKLIHRDLNPKNVIMEPTRGPVIIDLNIAYRIGEPCGRSGTDYWSAPEQLDASFDVPSASAESDLYAIAATFLFLVTGDEPSSYYKRKADLERVHRHLVSVGCIAQVANQIAASMSFNPSDRDCTLELLKIALSTAVIHNRGRGARPILLVDGRRFQLNGVTEVGRRHRCENCQGREMIYVEDPNPFVATHSVQFKPTSDSTSLVALPGKNNVAVRKNGSSFTVIPPGRTVLLKDGDEIALAYNDRKGPFKVLKFIEE